MAQNAPQAPDPPHADDDEVLSDVKRSEDDVEAEEVTAGSAEIAAENKKVPRKQKQESLERRAAKTANLVAKSQTKLGAK